MCTFVTSVFQFRVGLKLSRICLQRSHFSSTAEEKHNAVSTSKCWLTVGDYPQLRGSNCNITPRIAELIGKQLHNRKYHPLNLVKQRVYSFFAKHHCRRTTLDGRVSAPLFSFIDNLPPLVTTHQNFDSLLIPPDHPSRSTTDTYYVNESTLLRSHTTAHDMKLLSDGLNAFLVTGDVYRRDEIDCLHYPVFHQLDGVRLFAAHELFSNAVDPSGCLELLEDIPASSPYSGVHGCDFSVIPSYALPPDRQVRHTYETTRMLEFELKSVLQALVRDLFGQDLQLRWVKGYFPFTHPSWELEAKMRVGYGDKGGTEEWTELLGCGLLRQELLERVGLSKKVGYAFGLGLERLAMRLYSIPDIRLFWSGDTGFLHQFETDDIHKAITYKPVSVFPQCALDMSFWLPEPANLDGGQDGDTRIRSNQDYSKALERDFYDLVRSNARDLIEQVRLIDHYIDPKTGRQSHCYRLVYRDQNRTLAVEEVRPIHELIAKSACDTLNVTLR